MTYMYMYMYMYMYTHTHTHTHTHVCVCVCFCVLHISYISTHAKHANVCLFVLCSYAMYTFLHIFLAFTCSASVEL